MKRNEKILCSNCEHEGFPKNKGHGSFLLEVGVWIVFLIIASASSYALLILPFGYSLYRLTSFNASCEKCGSINLLPFDSPKAKKILENKTI
jgi:hypothetical protein